MTSLTRPLCILIKETHILRGNSKGTHTELKGNPVIRLILTFYDDSYHPLTSCAKHILLNNFNILMTDLATATIFPAPPVGAHHHNLTLRDVQVHTSGRTQTEEPGIFACRHPCCRTCVYTSYTMWTQELNHHP